MSCRSAVSWFAQAVRRYRLGLGGGGDEDYAQSGFTCGMSHSILELSPLLCVNTCIGAVEPMHALAPLDSTRGLSPAVCCSQDSGRRGITTVRVGQKRFQWTVRDALR
jgi:hypothetical protein